MIPANGSPGLYYIAHRMNVGSPEKLGYNHVDNGMEALESVLEITGAGKYERLKGFECDIRLTGDNQLVVLHDANVKTMTKTKYNKNISEMTYDELRLMDIHNAELYYKSLRNRALLLPDSQRIRAIINQRLHQKTTVPKAFEMFEYLAGKGFQKEIVLELKGSGEKDRDATVELINAYKDKLNIVAKSFNMESILYIGEKTGIKIGLLEAVTLLTKRKPLDAEYIRNAPFAFYSILWSKLNNKLLEAFVENGKDLYLWTIDSSAHLYGVLRLLERYFDKTGLLPQNTHLITNLPILLDGYLNNENKNLPLIDAIHRRFTKLYGEPLSVMSSQ